MRRAAPVLTVCLAFAAAAGAVEVQPQAIVFRGKPGQRLEQPVTLTNRDDGALEVDLRAYVEKGGELKEDAPSFSASESRFSMGPHEVRKVALRCRMPRGRGEKIGALMVTRVSKQDESVETRSLHQVYFRVAGTEVARARFTAVEARRADGKVRIETVFKNTGNIHLQPRLVAEMDRKGGGKAFEIFPSPLEAVPPQRDAKFSVELAVPREGFSASTGVVTGFYQNADGAVQSVRERFTVQ